MLLAKNSNKRDTASLVAEIKKLGTLGKYKEVESGSFINGRNIDQFLQEERKTKEEFIASVRMDEPWPLLLKRGEARDNDLMKHF